MILDVLSNADLYTTMNPLFGKAMRFLREADLTKLPKGRYPIDGDRVFALVDEYTTLPAEQCEYEVHRRYWDIQCIVKGAERMGYAPANAMQVNKPYDSTTDLMFLRGQGALFEIREGMFAVFGLEDAHMPKVAVNGPAKVKKVVVKVAAS
jgi:biofilm protein TabA